MIDMTKNVVMNELPRIAKNLERIAIALEKNDSADRCKLSTSEGCCMDCIYFSTSFDYFQCEKFSLGIEEPHKHLCRSFIKRVD